MGRHARAALPAEPVEDLLAERLEHRAGPPGRSRSAAVRWLHAMGRLDREAYEAVGRWPTPGLDVPLRELSRFANFSKPWFLLAGLLAAAGGPRGRRAALTGAAAIGATSLLVNQPMKLAGSRARPDRAAAGVPDRRWVPMPTSTSFPSGHSASAAAFAVAVGDTIPGLRFPLTAAAATVGFSRVYTGVHYPGDVLVGASVGAVMGRLTSRAAVRLAERRRG
jgi:undecaprenyl-diphosphatase